MRPVDFVSADANARDDPLNYRLLAALLCCAVLFGDGGTVLFKKAGGPYQITLFGTPSPLRAGPANLSVLVQRIDNHSTVMDANVKLHLYRKAADNISEVFAPARHASASNKTLYAATVNLPSPGRWNVEVEAIAADVSGDVTGEVTVQEKQPALVAYWPYLAIVPLAIILFALNRWLRRRMYSRW